ncbi:MAG: hypothetical protein V4471_02770 [Pseudomonadota bacterium]
MPKKIMSMKFNTDINYSQSSPAESSSSIYYSTCEEKKEKEKEIIELDKKLKLVVELLSKVTDTSQRHKLLNKKKDCLEKKEALMKIINELSYVYTVLNKCTLFFCFVEEFYSLFFALLISDSDPGFSVYKRLNILKEKEEVLIKVADCKLYLKSDLEVLNYSEHHRRLEKIIDSLFKNFDKSLRPDSFLKYMLFCERISDIFLEPLVCVSKDIFNINDLEAFFQSQLTKLPMPSTKHSLVGVIAVFLYEALFKFLKCRPIASNFKKFKKYIKFHKDILNFPMSDFILRDLFSLKKTIIKLENESDIFFESELEFSKCGIDKRLIFFKDSYNKLTLIKTSLISLLRNEKYFHEIKMLNSILRKETKQDLVAFMENKTGLDYSLIINTSRIDNIKSNKEIIKYFFSVIYQEKSRDVLCQATENIIDVVFNQAENDYPIALEALTTKDLLCLSYLSFGIFIFLELNSKLGNIENKIMRHKSLTIQMLLTISLSEVDEKEKKLEFSEKIFFRKTYLNKDEFFKCKANLLDEITFLLTYIQDLILIIEEEQDSQWGFDYEASLSDISINIKSRQLSKCLGSSGKDLKTLNTLQARKKQLVLKVETIEDYLLSESCELTVINTSEKLSCSKKKELEVIEKLVNPKVLFVPMACLSKDLLDIAQYTDQPEDTIIKCSKNTRKRNKFFSTIGRIRASINLIAQDLNKLGANSSLSPNLASIFEAVKNIISKATSQFDSDEGLESLKKSIESCFFAIECIDQQIIAITRKYKLCNDEIEKFFVNDPLKSKTAIPNFFCYDSDIKKMNKLFKENYFILNQKMCWLKNIIKLIGDNESPMVIEFYNVVFQAEEYEKIFNCLKQQNDVLYTHPAPAMPDKNILPINNPENSKQSFKRRKKKSKHRKNLAINSETSCSENAVYELIELRRFSEWNAELEVWRRKRYFYLDNIFSTVEKCSFSILNKTTTVFLKILSYYEKEFIDKKQELKHQQYKLDTFFQYPLSCIESIKNLMIYYEQSFENVLARLSACAYYLLQSSEKYNFVVDNNFVANVFCAPYFPANQVVNNLLADYLNYFIIYTKNKNRLVLEEKKLSDISGEFIGKMLQKNSLNEIEQEADLLSKFTEKISEVNFLSYAIKEAQEQRQQTKEKLAQLIDPEALSFYLRRIDPSDTQILRNDSSPSITLPSYVLNQSSFYFVPDSLANLSVNSENYESNIGVNVAY